MPSTTFSVNEDTCIRCGLCVSDCVCRIIEMGELPFIAPANFDKCIRCGHCQAICPTESITLNGIDPKELQDTTTAMPDNVLAAIVKNRRSVRQFSKETIDENLLLRAIEIAAWAPTAVNMRDMGFVIFNGREKVEKLMLACANVMEKYNMLPGIVANVRNGSDNIFRGAPCVLAIHAPDRPFSISDCATTLAAIELALPSFGLASCWTGYFTTICGKELPAGLVIPEGAKILGGLMIGRPTVHYKKIPERPMPPIHWA